jgi:FkbM family methyltransferase
VQADGFWWYRWHPDAGIGFSNEWEKPIENYILRPGGSLVDVGSHVGRWCIRASQFYRSILAFEPDPNTNSILRRNIARNNIHNIRVFATALSNHRGQATLFNYGPAACNSLRSEHSSGRPITSSGTLVRARRLDDYSDYFHSPMVLKIDVEGEELKVLEGAAVTLDEYKPIIVVEVHFRNEIGVIAQEMKQHGYRILETFEDPTNPKGQIHCVAKHLEQ